MVCNVNFLISPKIRAIIKYFDFKSFDHFVFKLLKHKKPDIKDIKNGFLVSCDMLFYMYFTALSII